MPTKVHFDHIWSCYDFDLWPLTFDLWPLTSESNQFNIAVARIFGARGVRTVYFYFKSWWPVSSHCPQYTGYPSKLTTCSPLPINISYKFDFLLSGNAVQLTKIKLPKIHFWLWGCRVHPLATPIQFIFAPLHLVINLVKFITSGL